MCWLFVEPLHSESIVEDICQNSENGNVGISVICYNVHGVRQHFLFVLYTAIFLIVLNF